MGEHNSEQGMERDRHENLELALNGIVWSVSLGLTGIGVWATILGYSMWWCAFASTELLPAVTLAMINPTTGSTSMNSQLAQDQHARAAQVDGLQSGGEHGEAIHAFRARRSCWRRCPDR